VSVSRRPHEKKIMKKSVAHLSQSFNMWSSIIS
jgi:hypothetical protein